MAGHERYRTRNSLVIYQRLQSGPNGLQSCLFQPASGWFLLGHARCCQDHAQDEHPEQRMRIREAKYSVSATPAADSECGNAVLFRVDNRDVRLDFSDSFMAPRYLSLPALYARPLPDKAAR